MQCKSFARRLQIFGLTLFSLFAFEMSSLAQEDVLPSSPTFSDPVTFRWKIGATVTGGSSSCRNMAITIPVPTDWPEQSVRLASEELPAEVGVAKYRTLPDGVTQLLILLPSVPAGEVIEISQIYEVQVSQTNAPTETANLTIPKRVGKDLRAYLGVSPQISFRNGKLRNKVKALAAEQETAWEKVNAIYDWVRDNVEETDAEECEDTVSVFRNLSGNSEDKVGLFVAMCRALKIPARMVWVEGNQYAEFYLLNEDGYGNWYPCQLAGFREFGELSDVRIILQKGDNIKVPEKEAPQKYVAEFAVVKGKSRPTVRFVRELLPDE